MSPISVPLNMLGAVVAGIVTPLGLTLIFLPETPGASAAWILNTLVGLLVTAVQAGLEFPGATIRVPSIPPALWLAFALCLILVGTSARH